MKQKLIVFIIVFIAIGNLLAQQDNSQPYLLTENRAAESSRSFNSEQKISLSLRNIDVLEALKFFAMKSGLNIVPTQNVAGRVTLTVENVFIKDIFDIMLRSNNLSYDKKGQIYNVMTEKEYRALYGKDFFDTRKVKIFHLKNAVPDQAFSLLDTIKSSIGRLLVEPESGVVLLMDTPEKIEEAEKTLEGLEQKGPIKIFNLKYAKAKDVEQQLKYQLDDKKVGTVKSDERTNQVIVQTLPQRMKDIEDLISSLDKKTKAVMVDTKIIKITLSNQLDSGIEWEGIFNTAKRYGMNYVGSYPFSAVQSSADSWRSREKVLSDMAGSVGSYPFSGTTSNFSAGAKVAPGEKMHIGIIDGKRDFDVLVKYLQTIGNTKILSNPTISIVNNQEAKIHVGERRAYVTSTTISGASTTTVSEEVTFVDVGIKFSIIPTINEDGYITMKVKPEISSVIGNLTTAMNNLIPIIDTSSAETTVIAKDGATIMIGGLGREEKTEDSKQVPFLGSIPLLGFFFRSSSQKVERVELMIILTPIIFEGDKLVTPKDKEMEQYGIKEPIKFDVFKEGPMDQKNLETPKITNDSFILKGFKAYNIVDDEVTKQQITPVPVLLKEKDGLSIPKGFRPYN